MVGTRSKHTRPDVQAGEFLRQGREARSISLARAARELHMTRFQLEALEEGDFSVFAAEVYGRGAFVHYAAYLHLPLQKAERLVARALSKARERVPLRLHTPASWFERLTARKTIIIAISTVGVLVGGYIVWQIQFFWRLPRLSLQEPATATVTEPRLLVRGQAGVDARVLINEVPVLLGEEGAFEYEMWLHPGINVLRVAAENAAGRQRVIEQHVLFSRS